MGERLLCKQIVVGSIPSTSTKQSRSSGLALGKVLVPCGIALKLRGTGHHFHQDAAWIENTPRQACAGRELTVTGFSP